MAEPASTGLRPRPGEPVLPGSGDKRLPKTADALSPGSGFACGRARRLPRGRRSRPVPQAQSSWFLAVPQSLAGFVGFCRDDGPCSSGFAGQKLLEPSPRIAGRTDPAAVRRQPFAGNRLRGSEYGSVPPEKPVRLGPYARLRGPSGSSDDRRTRTNVCSNGRDLRAARRKRVRFCVLAARPWAGTSTTPAARRPPRPAIDPATAAGLPFGYRPSNRLKGPPVLRLLGRFAGSDGTASP